MHKTPVLLFVLSLCLAGCSTPLEQLSATPSVTAAIELSPTPKASPAPTQGVTDSFEAASATPTETLPPSSPTPQPEYLLCSPLEEHTLNELPEIISSPYEPPPPGKDERHHGVDFFYYNHNGRAAIEGEGVQAIMAGRVAASIHDRLPYGNMIIIETPHEMLPEIVTESIAITKGESLYHLYAHFLETPLAELDQQVECGQLLGHVGKTGYVVPLAHLHLETRIGPTGATFEGMVFFDTQATPEEQAAYTRWRTGGEFQHFDPMVILHPLESTP